MTNETFTLGGRSFTRFTRAEDLSAEQEDFLRARLRPAGLDKCTIGIDEDYDTFARRLILQCSESGKTFEILSSLLMPTDATQWAGSPAQADIEAGDWIPAIAVESAKFIRRLKDPDDKALLDQLLCALLMDFFARAISSLYGYRSASADQQAGDRGSETETARLTSADAGAGGQQSSEQSLETTTAAPG